MSGPPYLPLWVQMISHTHDTPVASFIPECPRCEVEYRLNEVGPHIAAIEAEAVAAERGRIEAALRAQPTPPRLFALSAWDLDCVLAIIRGETP
ncbi:MAG TPA: hypothetical protein VLM76_02215 [Patescibacteria group bacterium]|nr:hypothetical protein [Patescibacteria group bacterium]